MDIFLSVPEELSKQLFVEWLKIVDMAKLDSAYMSHDSRTKYLSLIASPQTVIEHVDETSFGSADDNMAYVAWVARRKCHIHSLCVPAELANNAELLNEFFQACGPSLNQMELRGYENKSGEAYNLIVACVTEHCHHLQELTLTEGFSENPNLLHQLCLRCPYINKLTFDDCMEYCGDQNKGLSFFALRTFTATNTPLSDKLLAAIATGSANLREFSLTDVSKVSTTGLEAVAANCPLLQTVRLITTYVEDTDLLPFITRCKHLHTLEVVEPDITFTDVSLTAIAENCPLLHTLCLVECDGIKDAGVDMVLKNCTELRDLSLEGTMVLTNVTLFSIAEHCPLLTTLNIEGGTYFSDAGLAAVAESCTRLQRVAFSTDGALTQESGDKFGKQVEVVCEEGFNDYISDEMFDLLDADNGYDSNNESD